LVVGVEKDHEASLTAGLGSPGDNAAPRNERRSAATDLDAIA
jgi:hypothetical protein